MNVRPMSGQRYGGDQGRRNYHHPVHLGDRALCSCGGFGPSNGSEKTEDGRHITQWRRCRKCGQSYTTTFNVDEYSN